MALTWDLDIDETDVRQVLKRFKAVAKKYDSIPSAY